MEKLQDALHSLGMSLRYLQRPMAVSEPCVGMSGIHEWCKAARVPYQPCNAMDTDSSLDLLHASLQAAGQEEMSATQIGPQVGDVLTKPLQDLEDSEGLAAGPPCQPWAGNGFRAGANDPRSWVYERVVLWILELAWRGCLVWFVLENSEKLQKSVFLTWMRRKLEVCLPFFVIEPIQDLLQTKFPHNRARSFLRGLRRDACPLGSIPAPKAAHEIWLQEKPKLSEFLDPSLQATSPATLSSRMARNLAMYEKILQGMLQQDVLFDIACVELDRCPENTYGACFTLDSCPPLRTNGPAIFLLSGDDLSRPWFERRLHRWLGLSEKFQLQARPAKYALQFACPTHARRAVGNAYNTLHLASVCAPMIEAACVHGVLKPSGPVKLTRKQLQGLMRWPASASPALPRQVTPKEACPAKPPPPHAPCGKGKKVRQVSTKSTKSSQGGAPAPKTQPKSASKKASTATATRPKSHRAVVTAGVATEAMVQK